MNNNLSNSSPAQSLFGFGARMLRKKFFYWGIGAIIIILVIAGGIWAYKNSNQSSEGQSVFSLFKKSELVGSGSGIGETAWLGNLRVTLHGIAEGTYRPLEVDDTGTRVEKGYFGADIEVYNSDLNTTDFLLYGLTDDLGNEYERDFEIDFYLDEIQDLGPADNYIPQTLRRGHLLFPPVDEKAKKLELTVYSKVKDQKVTFEIPLK